jgi:hypothetical protein
MCAQSFCPKADLRACIHVQVLHPCLYFLLPYVELRCFIKLGWLLHCLWGDENVTEEPERDVHALWAAALDLPNQNLMQEQVEYHVVKANFGM